MGQTFKALVISEQDGRYMREIKEKNTDELPDGEVLVRVEYSSLNYKDALSSVGNKGVTRKYPHTPGIDAAGVVEESSSDKFKAGDKVIVTSYDLGMNTPGGLGGYIRVPSSWVVPIPSGLTAREAMIYGTAGFTAGMSVMALINHGITPETGEVLVTGSTGGVGSVAVAILAKLGYKIACVTGKAEKAELLKNMGAASIITREEADDTSGRPMLKGRWSGVVDTVGGNILATAIKSADYGGAVTTCGLTQSAEFTSSVFPFILRGIALFGIDSVELPMEKRLKVWEKLSDEWKLSNLEELCTEIKLEETEKYLDEMLKGKTFGRIIVKH